MTRAAFPYGPRPLNFGHRGAPCAAPENTLAAFQRARELGADGVELDVMLSSDGSVVVRHDHNLERTTDGRGRVSDLTVDELVALDAGAWFGSQYEGQRIPTLREVLRWSGGEMLLNIELKTRSLSQSTLEKKVVALIHEHGHQSRVVVSSFNPLALWRVRRLSPDLHTGLLHAPALPAYLRRAWLRPLARPDALHPQFEMLNERYLSWARACGYRVNVWGAAQPEDLWRLIKLGADMIITDRPDVLAEQLQRLE